MKTIIKKLTTLLLTLLLVINYCPTKIYAADTITITVISTTIDGDDIIAPYEIEVETGTDTYALESLLLNDDAYLNMIDQAPNYHLYDGWVNVFPVSMAGFSSLDDYSGVYDKFYYDQDTTVYVPLAKVKENVSIKFQKFYCGDLIDYWDPVEYLEELSGASLALNYSYWYLEDDTRVYNGEYFDANKTYKTPLALTCDEFGYGIDTVNPSFNVTNATFKYCEPGMNNYYYFLITPEHKSGDWELNPSNNEEEIRKCSHCGTVLEERDVTGDYSLLEMSVVKGEFLNTSDTTVYYSAIKGNKVSSIKSVKPLKGYGRPVITIDNVELEYEIGTAVSKDSLQYLVNDDFSIDITCVSGLQADSNIKISYIPNQYYVEFHKEWYFDGTMENQLFTYDEPQKLNPNQYTQTGYDFDCWSFTDSNWNHYEFQDEQEVLNLTSTHGGTVVLYPSWIERIRLDISFTNYNHVYSDEIMVNGVLFDRYNNYYSKNSDATVEIKIKDNAILDEIIDNGSANYGVNLLNFSYTPEVNGKSTVTFTFPNRGSSAAIKVKTINAFRVSLDKNGGSENDNYPEGGYFKYQQNATTQELDLSDYKNLVNPPKKHKLIGFEVTDADGTRTFDQDETTITVKTSSTITIKYLWEEVPNAKVILDINGGTKAPDWPEEGFVEIPHDGDPFEVTLSDFASLAYGPLKKKFAGLEINDADGTRTITSDTTTAMVNPLGQITFKYLWEDAGAVVSAGFEGWKWTLTEDGVLIIESQTPGVKVPIETRWHWEYRPNPIRYLTLPWGEGFEMLYNPELPTKIKSQTKRIVITDDVYLNGDMSELFYKFKNVESINMEDWDVSQATDLSNVFGECESLRKIDITNWDTSKCEAMTGTFAGCKSLDTLDVSGIDVSNLKEARYAFASLELSEIDISTWDTSSLEDAYLLFGNCQNLTRVIGIEDRNFSNLKSAANMFENTAIASIDISRWDTGKLENANAMFKDCVNLETVIGIEDHDFPSVKYLSSMFNNTKLKGDITLNWDCRNVENIAAMFRYCKELTSVTFGEKWRTTNLEFMHYMFHDCSNLVSVDLRNLSIATAKDMQCMFWKCINLEEILLDEETWDTSNMQYMVGAFGDCEKLTSLDTNFWNTANVREIGGLFWGCKSLKSLDLTSWSTEGLYRSGNNDDVFDPAIWTLILGEKFNEDDDVRITPPDMWIDADHYNIEEPSFYEYGRGFDVNSYTDYTRMGNGTFFTGPATMIKSIRIHYYPDIASYNNNETPIIQIIRHTDGNVLLWKNKFEVPEKKVFKEWKGFRYGSQNVRFADQEQVNFERFYKTKNTWNNYLVPIWADDVNENGIDDETEPRYNIEYYGYINETDNTKDTIALYNDVLVELDTPLPDYNLKRDKEVFLGWSTTDDKNNLDWSAKVSGNVKYYAVWAKDINENGKDDETEPRYTVTYTDGKAGQSFVDEVYTGILPGLPTPSFSGAYPPILTDYVFTGWKPSVAGVVNEDVTYIAKWDDDKNNDGRPDIEHPYTVNFDSCGKDWLNAPENQTKLYGEKVAKPDDPNAKGFIFDGWYKENTYDNEWNFNEDLIIRDTTIYAKWIIDENYDENEGKEFTLSFDPSGGSWLDGSQDIKEFKVVYGSTFTIIDGPEKEGYEFEYWKGSKYFPNDSYEVLDDHKFTAIWKLKETQTIPNDSENEKPIPYEVPKTDVK